MLIILCVCLAAANLKATEGDTLVVSFSKPSQPGTIKTELMAGSIHVQVHNSPDVHIIATEFDDDEHSLDLRSFEEDEGLQFRAPRLPARPASPGTKLKFKNEPDPEKVKGLQKVQSSPYGINVEENDNIIEINLPPMAFMGGGGDLLLLTPKRTSLQLRCLGGNVVVENVDGEIEVEALGGNIKLTAVSGAVVAHTMGDIEASIIAARPNSPMSFSTFGGDIDVSLPATLKATLILSSHGDIYTDFDASKRTQRRKVSKKKEDRRQVVDVEEVLEIPINGGGPEIELSNFNGNIYIRKGK